MHEETRFKHTVYHAAHCIYCRTGKSVDDRDWNGVKRQCMEESKVEVGS